MTEIVPVDAYETELARAGRLDNVTEAYREFRDAEGVPVHTGLALDDWNALETGPWDRTGQRGAFVNLYGAEGVNDVQVHELAPTGETAVLQHRFEEIVYVAEGSGFTAVGTGEEEVVFEWDRHALFFLPPNVPYRHVNAGEGPARLLAATPLPQLLTMYRRPELLFAVEGDDWGRFRRDEYYSADATVVDSSDPDEPGGVISWVANFVPDVFAFERLEDHPARGAGGTSVIFPFPDTSMWAHISEFPPGRYKKAHRHHPGANVGILSGEGFSLLWEAGWERKVRVDWDERSLFVPPARWYHQHFNVSERPDRYFAMHAPKLGTLEEANLFDYTDPRNQIEYTDEDPAVRALYERELAERGLESAMPDAAYEDPAYVFEPAA